ncbi:unnamed protein product [marine sediment metagenome]|uniref:Fibronectin type-III domain-containing protein n=1 Tax=marine sediment metagenome TaxID=412755 RepID=X1BTC1_9ZZZZ
MSPPKLSTMVSEFTSWGSRFYPNPVMYQIGYPADKNWWNKLDNPPKDIGDALDEAIPNDMGIIWVDFTLRDVFPSPGEDTTPPEISDIATSDITGNSATITWTTDEISDGVVNYGENTALGSSESDTGMFVEHIVTLTELSASTTYYYEVQSKDWDGNNTVDDNNGSYYTFTTCTTNISQSKLLLLFLNRPQYYCDRKNKHWQREYSIIFPSLYLTIVFLKLENTHENNNGTDHARDQVKEIHTANEIC